MGASRDPGPKDHPPPLTLIGLKGKYFILLTIILKDLDIFNVNIEKSLTNTYTNIADIQVGIILNKEYIYIFEL